MDLSIDPNEISIFNKKGEKIYEGVTPHSTVSIIARWHSLCRGSFGLSLKPKVNQIRLFGNMNKLPEICLLEDSDDEK